LFKKPLYPFIFALHPVLLLYAHNIEQIRLPITYRSFAVTLLSTAILIFLLWVICRNWHRAALVTLLLVFLFFSYGHIYLSIKHLFIGEFLVGRHRYLIPLWTLTFICGCWIIFRKITSPEKFAQPLNVITSLVFLFPLLTTIQYEYRYIKIQQKTSNSNSTSCDGLSITKDRAPDVYYIILDAYAGHDTLWEAYHLNNTEFLETLSDIGFFVADRSQSNYNHTELSLSSSLNLDYLQSIDPVFATGGPDDNLRLAPLLTQGLVRRNFECLGYKIITFDSNYYWTGWRDSDLFIDPQTSRIGDIPRSTSINSFESLLINTSAGLIITSYSSSLPKQVKDVLDSPFQKHRDRSLSTLSALEENIPFIPEPTFSFAHILLPHPPYVFGPNGEPIEHTTAFTLGNINDDTGTIDELIGYPYQVQFINKRIVEVVQKIIETSRIPPIIIIQGDHGNGRHSRDKVSILNAYYFPGMTEQLFYSDITPVNSFRVLFNVYFGGDYELLEDVTYYSPAQDIYDFTVVPNERLSLEDYPFIPQ
jgi:hypothetical protein